MGAGCSSLASRRSSRRSLCAWLRPDAADKGRRRDAAHAAGAAADGVVVMPLQNPPDVIEAHQRYYSYVADPGRGPPTPTHPAAVYSYFPPSAASSGNAHPAHRPHAPTARPRRPALDCTATATATASRQGHADRDSRALKERTLPTQHQHPSPSSPRHPKRWPAGVAASGPGPGVPDRAERSRCRSHGHGARPRNSRTSRTSRAPKCSRTCRAPKARGTPSSRGTFGYDIQDVDSFLAKASLEKPANIPMVLACPSTLYRTEEGGWQQEVPLPLGMVVNGVFRVDPSPPSPPSCWLYAQTPHGHEGYVRYSSCLPLGILTLTAPKAALSASATTLARSITPAPSSSSSSDDLPAAPRRRGAGVQSLTTPSWSWRRSRDWGLSWDTASDVFPATLASALTGNQTDTDKAKDTRSERGYHCSRAARADRGWGLQFHQGLMASSQAERSVDELYLRSIRSGSTPSYAGGSIYFSRKVNV